MQRRLSNLFKEEPDLEAGNGTYHEPEQEESSGFLSQFSPWKAKTVSPVRSLRVSRELLIVQEEEEPPLVPFLRKSPSPPPPSAIHQLQSLLEDQELLQKKLEAESTLRRQSEEQVENLEKKLREVQQHLQQVKKEESLGAKFKELLISPKDGDSDTVLKLREVIAALEEELERFRREQLRADEEIARLQMQIQERQRDRFSDQTKIERLIKENAQLKKKVIALGGSFDDDEHQNHHAYNGGAHLNGHHNGHLANDDHHDLDHIVSSGSDLRTGPFSSQRLNGERRKEHEENNNPSFLWGAS